MAEQSTDRSARMAQAMEWMKTAQDQSPGELREETNRTCDAFLGELYGLTEEQRNYSPGEGEWSVKEVCLHIAHVTRQVGMLIPVLAAGHKIDAPEAQPGELDDDPGNLDAIRESLVTAFERASSAAGCLEQNPNLEVTFNHPWFGPFQCKQWMAFNILHINVHIRQLQRIKNSTSFPE